MITASQPPAGRLTTSPHRDDAALRHAAQAFEAIFLRQMIGAMRAAKLADDDLSGSSSDQFVAMQDDQIADAMAAHGRFGIAEMLTRQLGRPGAVSTAATP